MLADWVIKFTGIRGSEDDIRCIHYHGAVRVHKRQSTTGRSSMLNIAVVRTQSTAKAESIS